MLLLCYTDADAGFGLYGEVIGENGDSLDEPSDQSFVELCDDGFLLASEVLQFFRKKVWRLYRMLLSLRRVSKLFLRLKCLTGLSRSAPAPFEVFQ